MADGIITPEVLIKRRWHPHPLIAGMYQRDGRAYVTEAEAIAQEVADQHARDLRKLRTAEGNNAAAMTARAELRAMEERAFYEAESLGRREAHEKHYVVPSITLEQAREQRAKAARDASNPEISAKYRKRFDGV